MKANDSYFLFIQERFSKISGISYKKMFSGMGVYKNGVIFGMVIDGELYFKVDDSNREEFESSGASPFSYQSRGKEVTTSYWRLPEEILENKEELNDWINVSYSISLKNRKK